MFQFVAVVAHVFSDIDVQNEDGDTALHLAAEFDQPSVIEALLKHKADFHKVRECEDELSWQTLVIMDSWIDASDSF